MHIGERISDNGWAFFQGRDLSNAFNLKDSEFKLFAEYWENLQLDEYMGDKGRYRYRRYSELKLIQKSSQILVLPHKHYEQSKRVNPLNGGVKRYFQPIEESMILNPFFKALILGLRDIFEFSLDENCEWSVKLHPYRITSDVLEIGKPTPEGLHRDGVDFIAMMLINRSNIEGGETTVTNTNDEMLTKVTMSTPLDIIVGEDSRIMHSVSPIIAKTEDGGYRDVFVIAFERLDLNDK
nr:2OG-Fe dioxygenase family protein [Pseudomonas luteola]